MASNRSKQILALIQNSEQHNKSANEEQINMSYNEATINITGEYHNITSDEKRSSPLPPGAEAICEQMHDVLDDIFSNNDCQEDSFRSVTISSDRNESTAFVEINPSAIPVSVTSYCSIDATPLDSAPLTIEDDGENNSICPCDVIRKDTYMPTNTLTPISMNYSLTISSLPQNNIDSPMPLTPIFSDLGCEPSPVAYNVDQPDQFANPNTPVPSPVNIHAKCKDSFCCQHEPDEFACSSVDTNTTISNQPSLTPFTLMRNRGKKRPRNYDNWGDVQRKNRKNLGKSYCSKRGRTVDEKTMGPPCGCRFKCNNKISIEERRDIFTKFWSLGDRQKQWLHIAHLTKKLNKNRTFRRELKHNRQYTYKYFLPKIEIETINHNKIDVCKTMFLNTLGITERMTRTAWQKYDGSAAVEEDLRGHHSNHKKVVDDEMILSVCAHVKSFVPVESHYCRKSSKRLYLDGSLSVARMFNMYNEWSGLSKYLNLATSLRQYRDIVNSHFNLTFHIPKKDKCDQCHSFQQTEYPSEELISDYEEHQKNKFIARHLKKCDKTNAMQSNGAIICATFDFQKVLTCPHGQISVLYYKRKLSCYNFTIYDMGAKDGYCYVWDESIAKCGANEVASCLYNFLRDFSRKGVKDFRFWSDNCVGQNKNRVVFAIYSHAAKELGISITHRFMEKGHTQNECDSVHSIVERAGEHKVLYTPEEWKLLIQWSKIDKPYKVIDVNKELVYDFKETLKTKIGQKTQQTRKCRGTKLKR